MSVFKTKAPPTIDADVTIVGQGREQVLKATFKTLPAKQYQQLLEDIAEGKVKVTDALAGVMTAWNADTDLSAQAIEELNEEQPGAAWAILTGYGQKLTVARKGN